MFYSSPLLSNVIIWMIHLQYFDLSSKVRLWWSWRDISGMFKKRLNVGCLEFGPNALILDRALSKTVSWIFPHDQHLFWFPTIEVVIWQSRNNVLPEALQRDDLQRHNSSASSHVSVVTVNFTIINYTCKLLYQLPADMSLINQYIQIIPACRYTVWGLLTLWGWDLAQFSSLAKTPSLHSMIQCSSMGKDSILVAAMAMPKPISRTRPPTRWDTSENVSVSVIHCDNIFL